MSKISEHLQQSQQSLGNWLVSQLANELSLAADENTDSVSHAPLAWDIWLRELFPDLFKSPFAPHHKEFWDWVETIQRNEWKPPFIAIWARGAAKTTSAESAVVRLGAKGTRNFCLYVRSVQERANESVRNIAAMLESPAIEKYYPALSRRKLSKYGFSQGWTADMLRCSSGFSVVGLGFDAAVRGVKIEGDRPDLIVFDDIDEKTDTPRAVEKKIRILTNNILPAGSSDAVVLGIQNLLHEGGIFAKLVDGTADFLYDKHISGPHPAVVGLTYEERPQGGYHITGGTPTWVGQNLETCERQINEWGITAFLQEAQHEIETVGSIWQNINFRHCDIDQVPDLIRSCVWVDPAVTATNESDCQAIQADGLGSDGKLYRFFSWEAIATPEEALTKALLTCLNLGFDSVGVETDQGGDTWQSVYSQVWANVLTTAEYLKDLDGGNQEKIAEAEQWLFDHKTLAGVAALTPTQLQRRPVFKSAKAGAGHGSKLARNQRMLVSYEQGKVIHVRGTHGTLERSLKRFPNPPLDLADASYWGWYDLVDSKQHAGKVGKLGGRPTTQRQERQKKEEQEQQSDYLTVRYKGNRNFPLTIGKQTYMIGEGWQRAIARDVAEGIVEQFPEHFELA